MICNRLARYPASRLRRSALQDPVKRIQAIYIKSDLLDLKME